VIIISRGCNNIFKLWLQEPHQEIRQILSHVCSELLSSYSKQAKIIFLTNIQQTKALLRKITRLRKKIVILMKTKFWGDITECFLPSSHKWLEFTYVDYLWLVLHRDGFARCYVLCEWDSDHLSGNWDKHFMLLGRPWKTPKSNNKEQIDDAARHL